MPEKPRTAAGYAGTHRDAIMAACLDIAVCLGDQVDNFVIVGGLVPSLLVPEELLPPDTEAHPGTRDIDLGLRLSVLDTGAYSTISERLRRQGFAPDVNERENPTRHRWQKGGVTVDFLIAPSSPDDKGGAVRNLESDFAAIVSPGLDLAFRNRRMVRLEGRTSAGEIAQRDVWVCGAGAFVVLKALAFDGRGEPKDAYDLYYVARYFGARVEDLALELRPLLSSSAALKALEILERDFVRQDTIGTSRAAEFVARLDDETFREDIVGVLRELIRLTRPSSAG